MSDSQVVFGEIDWNSADVPTSGKGNDFLKLKQGKTRVRIMGNPTQFYTHWVETPQGEKTKVNSPISDPKLVRKLEDAGFKRGPRWMLKVLDRDSGEFKLLEVGSQIYNGVKSLYLDEDWGAVTGYDITIERGTPGSQPLYRVTPRPKSPLESKYKDAFIAFNDRVNISKLTQPADPSEVRKLMGWSDASTSDEVESEDDDFFNFDEE